jgi:dipeptidase E
MKNLILTSWGDANVRTDDPEKIFISLIAKKRMLFIPLANNGVPYTNKQYYDLWINQYFGKFGFNGKVDMWEDLSSKSEQDLKEYGGIFILGGNTFDLLDRLRTNDFTGSLSKYIDGGGAIFGVSAGAIILAKDIGTAYYGGDADTNRRRLTDLRALNKIFGFSIAVHYREDVDDENLFKYANENNIKVIALKDDGAIYVTDEKVKVLGKSDIYIFTENKRIILTANSEIWKQDIERIAIRNSVQDDKKNKTTYSF